MLPELAPAAIENVFDELSQHGGSRFGVEDLFLMVAQMGHSCAGQE